MEDFPLVPFFIPAAIEEVPNVYFGHVVKEDSVLLPLALFDVIIVRLVPVGLDVSFEGLPMRHGEQNVQVLPFLFGHCGITRGEFIYSVDNFALLVNLLQGFAQVLLIVLNVNVGDEGLRQTVVFIIA